MFRLTYNIFLLITLNTYVVIEAELNFSDGLVPSAMQNLAYNSAAMTDALVKQLSMNIEDTAKQLFSDVDAIISMAMSQLSAPMTQASKRHMDNSTIINVETYLTHVGEQLSLCTQPLSDIIAAFQQDANVIVQSVHAFVNDLASLPQSCQLLKSSSFPTFNCFMQRLGEINQSVAEEIKLIDMTLMNTRQLIQAALLAAAQCADEIVASTTSNLTTTLRHC